MDKLRNVLNPGFKEQDELLYDTGSSKKTHHHGTDVTASGHNTTGNTTGLGSSHSNTTLTSGQVDQTGTHHSGLASGRNQDPIVESKSRTASNQRDHMNPKDYEAARTAGTGLSTAGNTQQSTQPAFGSATGAGVSNYPHHEPHKFQTTPGTSTERQDLTQQQTHHTGRDAALGAGVGAAAVGAHQHHEHNKLHKENPNASTSTGHQTVGSGQHDHHSQHNHHTARDTALGAGTVGGVAHHEHSKHETEEPKEKKSILKKIFSSGDKKNDDLTSSRDGFTHERVPDQHEHHTGRDAALGAGVVGGAAAVHHQHNKEELEEPKEKKNILKQIFSSSDKKHDESSSHATSETKQHNVLSKVLPGSDKHNTSSNNQHSQTTGHSGHSAASSVPPANAPATNSSIGSAQAAAPIGAAAVGSAVAGHEMHKHHQHNTGASTIPVSERSANQTGLGGSTVPAVGYSTQTGIPPTTERSTHQPVEAGYASSPLGAGSVAAVIGSHDHKKHDQEVPSQRHPDTLTHHQHNTGSLLSHNESSGHQHKHDHHTHHEAIGAAHDQHNHPTHSGHEQRDLHQHGGNDQLSHHVHNGVTAMPHHSHGNSSAVAQEENAGHHRMAAGPALGAGAATAGIAAAGIGREHESKREGNSSSTSTSGGQLLTSSGDSGPASKTKGPHKSNILNILDPRVKPDMQALKEDKEAKKEEKQARKASGSVLESETPAHTGAASSQTSTLADRSKNTVPSTAATGTSLGAGTAASQLDSSATPHSGSKATEITNEARGGHHDPHVAFAGSGSQGTSGTQPFTNTSDNIPERSGAAGTHSEPAHIDPVKGIVTGERGITGDPSNVYSQRPLDPRVSMPGSYPDSSTNVNKTT